LLLEVDNGRKALIAVANGTLALSALVSGLRLYHGKPLQFATQAFTFPASVQGPLQGTKIIDVDAGGGLDLQLLDPESIDGLIVTNCFGHVVEVAKYQKWCETHQKFLLFDNAATVLTRINGVNIVNYGVGCILSLHHTKPLGFVEGGVIVVDKVYETAIRQVINFGYDVPKGDMIWQPEGSNYKMSDVSATFINAHLDGFADQYNKTTHLYRDAEKLLGVRLFPNHGDDIPFASCLPVLLTRAISLDEVRRINCKYKVNVRKYYKPLTALPRATLLWEHIVCFPLHRDVTSDDLLVYRQILTDLESGSSRVSQPTR
jgi:dTDP-4-amino-4,6-dideoxygalactose transaminase